MALIKCKNCGREISDKTTSCVHCGAPTRGKNTNYGKLILNWIKKHIVPICVIVSLVIIIIVVKTFFISLVRVSGNSMEPSLSDGEIKILDKVGIINRFDIIVFADENNNLMMKRVYGLPEETISYNNGEIFIGSRKITEDKYANGKLDGKDSVTLKNDEYYVLGDNRDNSIDSRNFGPINKSSIKGKLYGGNNKEIKLIEEVSKIVKINYEVKNQDFVDNKYVFDIYKPYDEVVVKGEKDNINKVDYVEIIVDFRELDNLRIGDNVLYDLPLIAYDKNKNKVDNINIIPQNAVNISINLTEK